MKAVLAILGLVLCYFALNALFAWGLLAAWTNVGPVFGWKMITFWQAYWMVVGVGLIGTVLRGAKSD